MVAAHGGVPRGAGVSRPLLLGIDEGTTAVKAVLYDTELAPVAAAERRVATATPRPGWVEQDAGEVLAAVVDAVAELLDGGHGDVVACGLDHQGESVVAWDPESGRPLTPVVVWQDKRAQEVLDRFDPQAAWAITRRSGLPLDPYFSAGKLAWLLEQGLPESARLGTVDAFLTDRLGGIFATDPSTASRTQLARVTAGAGGWDPVLCGHFGVPAERLPDVRDSVGELGVLRHPRWPAELPLTARVVDQQAALAGAGCVVPGRVKATYGTGVFVLANAGDGGAVPEGLLPTVAWRAAGRTELAFDGGVFTAGALLEWLARDLGLAADAPALAGLAETVPDAAGVRLLPALAGLGAPWWRPSAQGVLAGLTGATRPAHVARAALEAIAWRVADILDAVGDQVALDVVRVDGGLTRSPLLLQLQADCAGVPVETGLVDATAAGAAALAAVGAGVWPSTASIADRVPAGERVEPRRDTTWRREGLSAWRRFVEAAADL